MGDLKNQIKHRDCGAVEKGKVYMNVILNEVKNPSFYEEERCFVITQHDNLVTFSPPVGY